MFEQFAGATPWNTVLVRENARKRLKEGLDIVADAVGCTLGPRGRCVLIQLPAGAPIVTKDGVTVSKAINLRDPALRAGAEMIREAASRTADVAGDGTTTATVLTQAMVSAGLKAVDREHSSALLRSGIELAVREIVDRLRRMAKTVTAGDDLRNIATISANGDSEIGDLIATAVAKVGETGIVTVDDAKGAATSLEFVEGMRFSSGWLNSYFVTHPERMHSMYEDARVLLVDRKVSSLKDIVPLLEAIQRSQEPLLIIAEDVDGDALQGLVLNKSKGVIRVCAVKAPGWGSARAAFLQDIAALTGATVISAATGTSLEKVTMKELGRVRRVTSDKSTTTLVAAPGTEASVVARVAELKSLLEDATLAPEDRSSLLERIAKLTSGAAIIRVGGLTEVEVRERRDRIDDAICATRAALEEGVLAGGGSALLRAALATKWQARAGITDPSVLTGFDIVISACSSPLARIVSNSGEKSGDFVVADFEDRIRRDTEETSSDFYGWNAAKNVYGDMLSFGIIDPLKVTRTALENAASVAGIFLTLDAAIIDDLTAEAK